MGHCCGHGERGCRHRGFLDLIDPPPLHRNPWPGHLPRLDQKGVIVCSAESAIAQQTPCYHHAMNRPNQSRDCVAGLPSKTAWPSFPWIRFLPAYA